MFKFLVVIYLLLLTFLVIRLFNYFSHMFDMMYYDLQVDLDDLLKKDKYYENKIEDLQYEINVFKMK